MSFFYCLHIKVEVKVKVKVKVKVEVEVEIEIEQVAGLFLFKSCIKCDI